MPFSPGPFPPFVTPKNIYKMHQPRNPRLMEAMFFLGFVKMNREGTRRMRETMADMNLPAPEFEQKEIGHHMVRVTLRNNIKQRKAWIDASAAGLIGEVVFRTLSDTERLAINFVATNNTINVSDLQRQTGQYWKAAKAVLQGLCSKGIFREVRTKPPEQKDPGAYYELAK